MERRHDLIEIGLGGVLLRHERLRPRGVQAREIEPGLRVRQLALGLIDIRLKDHGIDLRDDLACFYDRIKIGEELLDVARDLAAHLDVLHWIQRPGRSDGLGDRAPGNGNALEVLTGATPAFAKHQTKGKQRDEAEDEWDGSF
jgi:hypothetical protein